jgi:hypothetical protein
MDLDLYGVVRSGHHQVGSLSAWTTALVTSSEAHELEVIDSPATPLDER